MKKNQFKVAIVGYGTVGKAMHTLFPNALIYSNFFLGMLVLELLSGIRIMAFLEMLAI